MDTNKIKWTKTADGSHHIMQLWSGEQTAEGWKPKEILASRELKHDEWHQDSQKHCMLYGVKKAVNDYKTSEKTLMTARETYDLNVSRIEMFNSGEFAATTKAKGKTVKESTMIAKYNELAKLVEAGDEPEEKLTMFAGILESVGITV